MERTPVNTPRPWHPYLLGLFPILFLYAQNADETMIVNVMAPMVVVLSAIVLGVGLINLFVRNIRKTSLIVSILVIYFFSWGHLPVGFRHHKNVLAYLLGLMVIAVIVNTLRTRSTLSTVTLGANRLGLGLVILQLGTAGWAIANRSPIDKYEPDLIPAPPVAAPLPNMYYIVPDGYARSDVLAKYFDYDNSEFLSHLRKLGFYVADSSCTNYSQTALSLTSSLNMQFISEMAHIERASRDRLGFMELYGDNRLHRFLRQYDYTVVSFPSLYEVHQNLSADHIVRSGQLLSEFSRLLILSTPLERYVPQFASHQRARELTLHTLEHLSDLGDVKEPYFVMAHILGPHPPFLWDEDGNEFEPDRYFTLSDGSFFMEKGGTLQEYLDGYRNQVRVVTPLLQQSIDRILTLHSDHPPIIIIQGDHGSGAYLDMNNLAKTDIQERFPILNAYFLPGVDTSLLYPTISPVNSFRLVLNTYFGLELPLAEDRSFYSTWDRPFDMVDVTDRLVGSP
jgi:hypothetical protein